MDDPRDKDADPQGNVRLGATRTLQREVSQAHISLPQATLTIVNGPDANFQLTLEGQPATLGHQPSCDLVIKDGAVSGEHLVVEPEGNGYVVRDLNSKNGTYVNGYHIKEIYLPNRATIELGRTRVQYTLSSEAVQVPISGYTRFGPLIGHSEAMRRVFAIFERIADKDATILLEGESGTGKDLAALAIHQHSARAEGPFVAIDCGAIPRGLIESELFGHVKGAFTGAGEPRAGLFEQADGGTVFLDEVGELPLDLQPKLLRVLQKRSVRRVGDHTDCPFDARIIAATNRNLVQEVGKNEFREDLFFRLAVIRVQMPPLRRRREEIPRLVAHFLNEICGDDAPTVPQDIMRLLCEHRWPGNVRELYNVVQRFIALPDMGPSYYLANRLPTPSGQNAEISIDLPFHEGKQTWIERFEREYLSRLLKRCGGNISELGRVSKLSRQSCHRLLKRHGLG